MLQSRPNQGSPDTSRLIGSNPQLFSMTNLRQPTEAELNSRHERRTAWQIAAIIEIDQGGSNLIAQRLPAHYLELLSDAMLKVY